MTALHHGSDPELEAVYPPISVGSGSSVHGHEVLYRHKLVRAVHTPQQVSVLLEYNRKVLQKIFTPGEKLINKLYVKSKYIEVYEGFRTSV